MSIFSLLKNFLLLFSSPKGLENNSAENLWTRKTLPILYAVPCDNWYILLYISAVLFFSFTTIFQKVKMKLVSSALGIPVVSRYRPYYVTFYFIVIGETFFIFFSRFKCIDNHSQISDWSKRSSFLFRFYLTIFVKVSLL